MPPAGNAALHVLPMRPGCGASDPGRGGAMGRAGDRWMKRVENPRGVFAEFLCDFQDIIGRQGGFADQARGG